MADKKTLADKIAELIFGMKFAAHKLKDGTEVEVDKVEVGGKVTIAGANAPSGVHELEDGTKVTVDENGLITEVVPFVAAALYVDFPLADGTNVQAESLDIGMQVMKDGMPVSAGEYPLLDGSVLVTDENGFVLEVKVPGAVLTPEDMQRMAAAFATGTPEERLARIETIIKPLMEYAFGWQMREAQIKADADAAIAIYKTGFSNDRINLAKAEARVLKLETMIPDLLEIMQELAGQPSVDHIPQKKKFSLTGKETDPNKKGQNFRQALADLNKPKN